METRFDGAARKAIDFAMSEVERQGHSTLDSLHLLVGLLQPRGGAIAAAAPHLGRSMETLRASAASALQGKTGRSAEDALEVAGATEQILQRASALAVERASATITDLDILAACAERADTAAGTLIKQAGLTADKLRTIAAALPPSPGERGPSPSATASGASGVPRGPGEAAAPRQAVGDPARGGGIRTGIGYDSHRFAPGGPLLLGGVSIPADVRLVGHSDGDAVAHAVTDALLGAAAAGDIGEMFSDEDPANRGRDSIAMLRAAVQRVRERGWRVVAVDVTVVAERPKLAPYRSAMRSVLAAALDVTAEDVGVKGKTNEGMGWIGRGEGLACIAVATLAALDAGA